MIVLTPLLLALDSEVADSDLSLQSTFNSAGSSVDVLMERFVAGV